MTVILTMTRKTIHIIMMATTGMAMLLVMLHGDDDKHGNNSIGTTQVAMMTMIVTLRLTTISILPAVILILTMVHSDSSD